MKAYVCGGADMMEEEEGRPPPGHQGRCWSTNLSALITSCLYHISPQLLILLLCWKKRVSSTGAGGDGVNTALFVFPAFPINLNPACLCLCAHQSISAQATSSGQCSELGVRTPQKTFCASALRRSKIPKMPAGNQALVIDPYLSPHPPGCPPAATSGALPAICQPGQRIPVC